MKKQDGTPDVRPQLRIDSHQHFWLADCFESPRMARSNPVLFRDYLPDDLVPDLAKQAQPFVDHILT